MSVAHGEPPALKRKATSPLTEHQSVTRPTSPPWNRACNRLRGRTRRQISPLVDTVPELPSKPRSQSWQKLGKEMGEIIMGLVNEKESSAALVLTYFHEDLYQQGYIDRSVNSETCHALLRSQLGENYMDLMASLIRLRKRCQWLQIRSRP